MKLSKYISVQTKVEVNTSLTFSWLPAFAKYLLTYHLKEFSLEILKMSRKLNLPLFKGFENISWVLKSAIRLPFVKRKKKQYSAFF